MVMSEESVSSLQAEIEMRLAASEPEVEVLLAEVVGGTTLRLFIDHPEGVNLALCERATKHLKHLLVDYSLEVSSPGPKYRDRRKATSSEPKESLQ
jgi:ribosome maturation factor RimP